VVETILGQPRCAVPCASSPSVHPPNVEMDGDLSLSQSFGGLRIANPDDADSTSPRENPSHLPSLPPLQFSPTFPSTPLEQDRRPNLAPPMPQQESSRTPSPGRHHPADRATSVSSSTGDTALSSLQDALYSSPNTNRRSVMYPAQQQQYPLQSPLPGIQQSSRMFQQPSSSGPRPSSTVIPQSSSNAFPDASSTVNGGSYAEYRLPGQSSRSSVSGLPPGSASRNGSSGMQAGTPTRELSHGDRSYRQTHIGNGPLPPRRSSRGQGRGHLGTVNPSAMSAPSGSPYEVEGGPLPSSEEWKDRGAAVGIRQELDRNGNPVQRYVKKGVKDFNFGRTLGEGSYSTVLAATDRQTLKEYAIKVLDKRHIIKERKVKYVNIEKNTLNRLGDHPGIVRLYYTFQDERSLYYVLDVASGGELLGVLKRMGTFDEECARYYGAQILDAVEYMHSRGVIHRDLKPENVLLDDQMHVKITDFGTAKILDPPRQPQDGMNGNIPFANQGNPMDGSDDNRANSFVGTAEYVSPELLTDKNACKASDLWAFGCIIYQLLSGRPPFKAANEYQTFQKIVSLDYEFPKGFPPVAKDLVERLLVLDPAKRLSIEHIKNHQFFDGIIWGRGLWKQKAPRLKSYVPPVQEPNVIKLNDFDSTQQNASKNGQGLSSGLNSGSRPQPRVITELPPPSQLDIEWSPVLTRTNERILKLGNLVVSSAPAPQSPVTKNGTSGEVAAVETPNKKFSRFFGGNTCKKRQRLVMVTSSARIILAAAGGDDKKAKTEISLLAPGVSWRSTSDTKGVMAWCVDTVGSPPTFLFPRTNTPIRTPAKKNLKSAEGQTLHLRGPQSLQRPGLHPVLCSGMA
jgi:3-phosphoinositide dependent protein kinase-1